MDTCVRWIPGAGKILWRRAWQPTQVFLLGESHGQRSLVGYSPWGCKRVGYNLATKQQHQQAVGSSTVCAWWLQNERSFVSVWIRFLWLPWQSTIDWGSEDNRHLFSSCPGGLKLEISEARPCLSLCWRLRRSLAHGCPVLISAVSSCGFSLESPESQISSDFSW